MVGCRCRLRPTCARLLITQGPPRCDGGAPSSAKSRLLEYRQLQRHADPLFAPSFLHLAAGACRGEVGRASSYSLEPHVTATGHTVLYGAPVPRQSRTCQQKGPPAHRFLCARVIAGLGMWPLRGHYIIGRFPQAFFTAHSFAYGTGWVKLCIKPLSRGRRAHTQSSPRPHATHFCGRSAWLARKTCTQRHA